MSPSPGYDPRSSVNYLDGNWTTSDPRKIAANLQTVNSKAATAGSQNATNTQGFLDPIEQHLAVGEGGYSPDEASQIQMTPQQQADIVNRAGTTAGAATAAGVDAATRASNAAGGNPAAVAEYRRRAAMQEGSQAADAMTGARIGASNAAAQRAENIGQTRIGQQNVGLGLQQQYQQQQNQDTENALNRQVQGADLGVKASQTPSTFDKIMGGVSGALPAALSFLDEGGTGGNAIVAEDGPEAVVKLEPKMSQGQRRQYGDETSSHMAHASSALESAAPGPGASRVETFLEQASAAKGDPGQAIQLARKADMLSKGLPPRDVVLDKLRDINTPDGPFGHPRDPNLDAVESRMRDYGNAEMNERNLSKGMAGRGGSPTGESATADMMHRRMQDDAEQGMRMRHRRSYHEDGGSGESGEEGMGVPSDTTQMGDDAATKQPWYKRFMAGVVPQPPTGQAPGAPAHMNGAGPTPPSMQSARTLGQGIGAAAKGIAGMFLEDGWTGQEPGTWGGESDGSIDSVSKFLDDGAMGAADGAIFTKPTEIKMGPHEAAVPLGYRARAKTRPSMALPVVNEIQQRRMYGGA